MQSQLDKEYRQYTIQDFQEYFAGLLLGQWRDDIPFQCSWQITYSFALTVQFFFGKQIQKFPLVMLKLHLSGYRWEWFRRLAVPHHLLQWF